MDTTNTLLLTAIILLILSLLALVYENRKNKKKAGHTTLIRASRRKRSKIRYLSLLFGVAALFIGIYLFILPVKAQSINYKEESPWTDFTKPLEIVFDKPVKKDSIKYSFSKEIKGTWKPEKLNQFDVFERKFVFYPEESPLPNEDIILEATYRPLFGFSEEKLTSKVSSKEAIPKIKVNEELEDRQNVNPIEKFVLASENGIPNSYVFTLESSPEGLFDKKKEYRFKDGNKIIIDHTPFINGQLYDVKIFALPISYDLTSKEIKKYGEKIDLKTIQFKAANTPVIKEVTPAGKKVLSGELMNISFDQPMNKASVEKNFKVEPASEGKFTWNENSTMLTFTPSKPLTKETEYKVMIGSNAESEYGAKLEQNNSVGENDFKPVLTHKFTTIGSVGVRIVSPGSGTYNVKVGSSIVLAFDQEVDKASAESKISISPSVIGKFSWNKNEVTFKPDTSLRYAQRYTITVKAGIKSKEGLDLKSNVTSAFNTESKTVLLNVPIMNQQQQFSCNVTAASIVLKYKGINVSPMDVYNSIPKQNVPKANGVWGNPNLGFVGNINGPDGYGVHWDPIRNYISKYRPAEVKRGWNLTDMLREVENGNPSILWWQNGYASPTRLTWTTPDGATINTVNGMHSEVVVGFIGSAENPSQIIISDPWASRWGNKYRYISVGQFNSLWTYFGNTAVVVR